MSICKMDKITVQEKRMPILPLRLVVLLAVRLPSQGEPAVSQSATVR